MNNRKKVWRQFIINAAIVVCSVVIIYVGLFAQFGWKISWLDGLNAELVFLMITSLGTVVGWRVVEGIKTSFTYNVILVIALFFASIEYATALIYKECEFLRMCIFFSWIPFFTFYVIEQTALFRHAKRADSKKKSDSLKYRGKD